MAAVKFYRTTRSAFDASQKEDGAIYFLTDVGALYIVSGTTEIPINLQIGLSTDASSAQSYYGLRKAVDSKLTKTGSGSKRRVYGISAANDQEMVEVGTAAGQLYLMPATGIAKGSLASGVQESLNKADSALQTHQDISGKINVSDATTAATENKVVKRDASGVSYAADFNWDTASGTALVNKNMLAPIKALAEMANRALSIGSYQELITLFNSQDQLSPGLRTGQSIYIGTANVPDLWIYSVSNSFVSFQHYTSEEAFANLLKTQTVQVGWYILAPLETEKVDISGKLDKVTSGSAKRVYGVTAGNGQAMLPVGTNAGDLLEMPSDGIPGDLLSSEVRGALVRALQLSLSGDYGINVSLTGYDFTVQINPAFVSGLLSSSNKLVTQAAVAENLEWHTL